MLIIYYSLSGITKSVATRLQQKTGADLFEIKTKKQYPNNYDTLIAEAKRSSMIIIYPNWLQQCRVFHPMTLF